VPEIPVLPSNASNDSQQKTKPSATTLANIINCTNNINHVSNQRSNNIAFSREILKESIHRILIPFPQYTQTICVMKKGHISYK
jgi:hypothetical protein